MAPSKQETVEDFEDELSFEQPSLTVPIEDDTEMEESSLMAPPRLSVPFDEGDQTGRSIEVGRRAEMEENTRLSRGNYLGFRTSDQFEKGDGLDTEENTLIAVAHALNDTNGMDFGDAMSNGPDLNSPR